jgi:hypothetical protein
MNIARKSHFKGISLKLKMRLMISDLSFLSLSRKIKPKIEGPNPPNMNNIPPSGDSVVLNPKKIIGNHANHENIKVRKKKEINDLLFFIQL